MQNILHKLRTKGQTRRYALNKVSLSSPIFLYDSDGKTITGMITTNHMFSAQMKLNQTRTSQIINLILKDISFRHSGEIETQSVGRKLVYLRRGFIAKRIPKFETEKVETICIEITIAKKKWCIFFFAYRPPNFSETEFFEEISVTLSKALNKYQPTLSRRFQYKYFRDLPQIQLTICLA